MKEKEKLINILNNQNFKILEDNKDFRDKNEKLFNKIQELIQIIKNKENIINNLALNNNFNQNDNNNNIKKINEIKINLQK